MFYFKFVFPHIATLKIGILILKTLIVVNGIIWVALPNPSNTLPFQNCFWIKGSWSLTLVYVLASPYTHKITETFSDCIYIIYTPLPSLIKCIYVPTNAKQHTQKNRQPLSKQTLEKYQSYHKSLRTQIIHLRYIQADNNSSLNDLLTICRQPSGL